MTRLLEEFLKAARSRIGRAAMAERRDAGCTRAPFLPRAGAGSSAFAAGAGAFVVEQASRPFLSGWSYALPGFEFHSRHASLSGAVVAARALCPAGVIETGSSRDLDEAYFGVAGARWSARITIDRQRTIPPAAMRLMVLALATATVVAFGAIVARVAQP